MSITITKPQIVRAVSELPEDATLEDAIERLLFMSRIEEGFAQARRGETFTQEEVEREMEARIASWQR